MIASKFTMPGHIAPAFSSGDDHLTCRMCLMAFSYPQRLPLSLNCLHTYCEHCVDAWTQNKTKEKLTCPICKKVTKITKGKTPKDCLPVNHAVLELAAVTGQVSSGGLIISGPSMWSAEPAQVIVPQMNGNVFPGHGGSNWLAGFSSPDQNVVGFNNQPDANYMPRGYPDMELLNPGVQGLMSNQPQQFHPLQPIPQHMQNNVHDFGFQTNQHAFYSNFTPPQIGHQMSQPSQPSYNQQNEQQNAFHADPSVQQSGRPMSSSGPMQSYQQNQQSYNAERIGQPTPFIASGNGVVHNSREFVSNVSIGDVKLPDANVCKNQSPSAQRSNQIPRKPDWNTKNQSQKKATKIQIESGRDSPSNWAAKPWEEPSKQWEEPNLLRQPGGIPAVTALAVNQPSPRATPEPTRVLQTSAKLNVDMCDVCGVQPASVTITSANHTTQRLCASCNASAKEQGKKQHDLAERRDVRKRESALNANLDALNSQGKTVVKVEDKNMPKNVMQSLPICSDQCVQHIDDDFRRESPVTANVLRLGAPARSTAPQKTIIETTFKSDVIHTKSTKVIEENANNRCNATDAGKTVKGKPVAITVNIGKPANNGTGVDNSATRGTSATINVGDTLKTERQDVADRKSSSRTRQPEPVASVRIREYIVHPLGRNTHDASAPVQRSSNRSGRNSLGPDRGSGAPIDAQASAPAQQSIYELRRPEAFNPQYDETASDTTSISDLGLPTVQPSHAPTTKLQEAMAYSRSYEPPQVVSGGSGEQQGAYHSGGHYPTLSAPPRYDEIVGASAGFGSPSQGSGTSGVARFIGSFGKYGEVSTQPGAFKSPTRVNVSPDGKVVVADQGNNNVQVFSGAEGECLSLIRVEGVNGCCIVKDGSLVAATSRGVEVYNVNGTLVKHVAMGPVLNVVRYGSGFIAVQPRALIIFRDMAGQSRTLADMARPGAFRQSVPFQDIADVAVNSQQDLVVLDGGAVYTLTEDGYIKAVIDPSREPCAALRRPQAVAVDRAHNVIVSDSGNDRVLLFGANGRYLRTLYEVAGGSRGIPGGLSGAGGKQGTAGGRPRGVDVDQTDRLFVVTKGGKSAEVVVLGYV